MTGSSPRQSSQGLSAVRERVADSVWIRHEYPLRGTCGQRVVNLLCVQVNHPLTTLINPLPTRRRETLCNSEVACGATTIKPVCIKEKKEAIQSNRKTDSTTRLRKLSHALRESDHSQ